MTELRSLTLWPSRVSSPSAACCCADPELPDDGGYPRAPPDGPVPGDEAMPGPEPGWPGADRLLAAAGDPNSAAGQCASQPARAKTLTRTTAATGTGHQVGGPAEDRDEPRSGGGSTGRPLPVAGEGDSVVAFPGVNSSDRCGVGWLISDRPQRPQE